MVDLQDQDVVAILTRAPSAGGKTRLFAELGCPPDPGLLSALLLDTRDAAVSAGMTCVVCFAPASAEREMRALVPDLQLIAQRGEDLGDRMRHAFDDLFARGAASVLLIGSDLPGLDPAALSEAQRALGGAASTVVLGPAADGGYYLIGAKQTPSPLFDGIAWSRPDVLACTERRAREAGMDVRRVAEACDIDSLHDLQNLLASGAPAVRTRMRCRALPGLYR